MQWVFLDLHKVRQRKAAGFVLLLFARQHYEWKMCCVYATLV